MTSKFPLTATGAGLMLGTVFFAMLTGCVVAPSGEYRGHAEVTADYEDDYDYYPAYQIYYSRNRHEYVYLEGNRWVRRPEPRGVSVNVLLAAPAVHMDFHDAPEHHHSTVVRSYPKAWARPETNHVTRPTQQEIRPDHPAVQHEQREVKPEHTITPAHPIEPAHPIKPEHPIAPEHPIKPEHPVKKKTPPQADHPENKDDDKKDKKSDNDENGGPNRSNEKR